MAAVLRELADKVDVSDRDDAPLGVPAADVLAGHPDGAGDLGLGVASGKQRPGVHADAFEGLAVAQTASVAAVGGWSHTAMLPAQHLTMSPEEANLFRRCRAEQGRRGWWPPCTFLGRADRRPGDPATGPWLSCRDDQPTAL